MAAAASAYHQHPVAEEELIKLTADVAAIKTETEEAETENMEQLVQIILYDGTPLYWTVGVLNRVPYFMANKDGIMEDIRPDLRAAMTPEERQRIGAKRARLAEPSADETFPDLPTMEFMDDMTEEFMERVLAFILQDAQDPIPIDRICSPPMQPDKKKKEEEGGAAASADDAASTKEEIVPKFRDDYRIPARIMIWDRTICREGPFLVRDYGIPPWASDWIDSFVSPEEVESKFDELFHIIPHVELLGIPTMVFLLTARIALVIAYMREHNMPLYTKLFVLLIDFKETFEKFGVTTHEELSEAMYKDPKYDYAKLSDDYNAPGAFREYMIEFTKKMGFDKKKEDTDGGAADGGEKKANPFVGWEVEKILEVARGPPKVEPKDAVVPAWGIKYRDSVLGDLHEDMWRTLVHMIG